MAKIKVTVQTNKVGSKCEEIIDEPDWDEMTDDERENVCMDVMFEMIDWNYSEVGE